LTDRVDKLAQAVSESRKVTDELIKQAAERSKETDERFRETDQKLNALIKIVDDLIRNRPRPNGD
jgi:hypothetical protein